MKREDYYIFDLLKICKPMLTKEQYRTIKGQAIAGDINGAYKGLQTIIHRKEKEGAGNA